MRIVVATTGDSFILSSLFKADNIKVVGVVFFEQAVNVASEDMNIHIFSGNLPAFQKWLSFIRPELMVVYKMPFLLPKNIFSIPRYGSINIHPSLLPKYRGPNPWFWIYYNMEEITGMTIHKIDELEDHGDILAQVCTKIKMGEGLQKIRAKIERLITPHLFDVILNISKIKGRPQHTSKGLRASYISNYTSIIDLSQKDVAEVWHLLRGFPWLLSFITRADQVYNIGAYEYKEIDGLEAGTIFNHEGILYLRCSNGIIELKM